MPTIKLTIKGKVQGVGFRFHAAQLASKHDLKGYAKNIPGAIEIVAQGRQKELDLFVRECRRGPLLSKIEGVQEEKLDDAEEFEEFEVQ